MSDPYEKSCQNCENRCMDMEMDPYCCQFNEPWGLILYKAKEKCLKGGELTLWQRDRRGEKR